MDGAAREQVVLTDVPSLGGLYARAAAGAAAGAAGRTLTRRLPGRPGRRSGVEPVLPAVEHVVEGVAVDAPAHEAFSRTVGAPLREGARGTEAFSGYLHALAFPVAMSVLTRGDFPLPVLGMVHLANEVEHRGAVTVGEDLTVTAHAERLRPHRAGAQVDLVVRLAREDGELVWTGRSTYLAKGARVPGPVEDGPRREFVPPAPTGRWRLPARTGRDYAAVSGDWNPIHLSGPSARALGMKGAIAHGMYCASRALAEVGVPAGTGFRWTVEFAAPVLLPGTVAVAVGDAGRGPQWRRSDYAGWDPRRGRPHFTGAVERLGP
ncbi:MaoC/PaaZ C-terminal domain-containing protein [Kocuria turfanensis]|uniref:Acyl dehydratase n=1 Tax=Kocuria turfanensis TaxID=388357 RepID=A0A512IAF3_9MICC|nr:MaoC/PaaZ C-terminal domain-containing protein [Kocuria turfanensis]GEO94685.1 acyl dehydratase [Kocuria turfanensis]